MRYVVAIVLPPLGLLMAGRPFQAILCLVLMVTVIGWPIAAVWAIFAVHSAELRGELRQLRRALDR
jgi:uncharacterized membrane protein YqaE (UPF0057 family)